MQLNKHVIANKRKTNLRPNTALARRSPVITREIVHLIAVCASDSSLVTNPCKMCMSTPRLAKRSLRILKSHSHFIKSTVEW